MKQARQVLRGVRSVLSTTVAFWTSRPLLLAGVAGLVATIVAFGSMRTLAWMETPGFCGRCHTMQLEVAARYRIVGIPTHFFVDRDGILREWRIGSMSKKTMEKNVGKIMFSSTAAPEQ